MGEDPSFMIILPPDKTIDKTFEGELTLILMLIYISTLGETNTANSLVCFNFSKSASKRRDLKRKERKSRELLLLYQTHLRSFNMKEMFVNYYYYIKHTCAVST